MLGGGGKGVIMWHSRSQRRCGVLPRVRTAVWWWLWQSPGTGSTTWWRTASWTTTSAATLWILSVYLRYPLIPCLYRKKGGDILNLEWKSTCEGHNRDRGWAITSVALLPALIRGYKSRQVQTIQPHLAQQFYFKVNKSCFRWDKTHNTVL